MTKILDCTLRDGGHVNKWNFSDECIISTLKAAEKSAASTGYSNGYKSGYASGQIDGYNSASEASRDAYSEAWLNGWDGGYNSGYEEGYNASELSKIFHLPPGTVRTRLRKARTLLKHELLEE